MRKLRQNKEFRVFIWQLLDVIIVFGITFCNGIQGEWQIYAAGLGVPILMLISKAVNKKLGDLGVDKDLENTH